MKSESLFQPGGKGSESDVGSAELKEVRERLAMDVVEYSDVKMLGDVDREEENSVGRNIFVDKSERQK